MCWIFLQNVNEQAEQEQVFIAEQNFVGKSKCCRGCNFPFDDYIHPFVRSGLQTIDLFTSLTKCNINFEEASR